MIVSMLTGCGSSAQAPAQKNAQPAATEANVLETTPVVVDLNQESIVKDTIDVGSTTLWETLTPFRNTSAQFSTFVRHIYDRLAFRTADGTFVPQAAKSWECGEDGLTYTIELYDYITDVAGNHITADDVVWIIEENMSRALKPAFNKIDKVEKTGNYTFNIVMKQDMVHMLEMILYSTYIFSKDAFLADKSEFATTAVTTSPYEVTDFVAGSHITFTLRDNYWQKDELIAPQLKNNAKVVTYHYITEASQQQIALETGTIQCMEAMASTSVKNFDDNNAFVIIRGANSNGQQMYFSGAESSPCANDENLRKAIVHAIDVNGIVVAAYSGNAEPMHDVVPRTNVGYLEKWDSEQYFGYDVNLSKEYLAKSSYNGQTLRLLGLTSQQRMAQMIQAYLGEVGIALELNVVDAAQWSSSNTDGNNYDIVLAPVGNGLVNLWANRFDGNAYANGDATSRKDEVLTDMLYKTWTNAGFTDENIDAVHKYIMDNCYAFGIVLPLVCNVYDANLGVVGAVVTDSGSVDMVASIYQ